MTPRQTIAHYQITAKLGAGGMGEVWRATDTKLGREVAIKILPEAFAHDADRLARFTREAQVLASLNHPNIAAIYGVEERALVMELVEGPTLAERIRQGPVLTAEAMEVARQIAEALEAAHEKGVVHRDLKPSNIKVTAEGRVKVLDFGLAKAMAGESISSDTVNSPTLTMRSTVAGVIMGTAGYMSPEQARGNAVEKRADIWAFGVVLYEMFAGRPLFIGETVSDTLAAVLTKDPEWEALPADLFPNVRTMLRRCLERDVRKRLRDIGDARLELEQPGTGIAIPARSGRGWPLRITAGLLAVGLLATGVGWWQATRPQEAPLMRFTADMGSVAPQSPFLSAALSPDGRRIVHPVQTPAGAELATRLLDQSQSTILPGTEDGEMPFFSPNGNWIGFFSRGKLRKVSVLGGTAVTLSDAATGPRGGRWGEDDTVIATLDLRHLFRVPASGGKEEMLKPDPVANGYTTYRWPQILPGGAAVLVTAGGNPGEFEVADIGLIFPKTGRFQLVARGGYYGRYLPSGHVIYVHEGSLYAVPFDIRRLESRGAPAPVLDDVASHSATGAGNVLFSQTGMLMYMSGKGEHESDKAVWMDATGQQTPLFSSSGGHIELAPRISGDGTQVAAEINGDISVFDIGRGMLTRITFNHSPNKFPVWTPDGRHIVYSTPDGIWWTRADGSSQPLQLLKDEAHAVPCSFSTDGRLAFHDAGKDGGRAISILTLDTSDPDHPKAGPPELFGPSHEIDPMFSPDGRWLASTSLDSALPEVYVRPYPAGAAGGARWQVSTSHGRSPMWSRNGRELLYVTLGGQIMAVDYTTRGGTFRAGKARLWCPKPVLLSGTYPHLDLAPDGKRVAALAYEAPADTNATLRLTFLLNFFDELKRRIPPK